MLIGAKRQQSGSPETNIAEINFLPEVVDLWKHYDFLVGLHPTLLTQASLANLAVTFS